MVMLVSGVVVIVLSGTASLLLSRWPRLASGTAVAGVVAGALLGLAAAGRQLPASAPDLLELPWRMPCGGMLFQLDALAAFFLLPILLLSALAAVYGRGYLAGKPRQGRHWFCFNLLVAAMAMTCVARHVLAFLLFWELMALASFFLVAHDNVRAESRRAAFVYLVATHVGTAFLFPMFLLLGAAAGSLDFAAMASAHPAPAVAGVCFLLAVVGFGAKAGFVPFHIWLPEAHPAAPSHVSALMSGVMIKTGIYGLLRVLTLLGPPPPWWGVALIAVGAVSGVLGVLFALAQHDLKRLLAYHSVENIGIITLGLGVGLLGLACGSRAVAVLGFAGGLLHVLNHALFKGLLFLGAGSALRATGTRELDHLGGLLKRMPLTGGGFLVGAAAISGLPPLNGFVSEFLIYLGLFTGLVTLGAKAALPLLGGILALVLIGGLAAACFAKAFGIVFLGEPRTPEAAGASESPWSMTAPMLILAAACFLVGLGGPWVVAAMTPVVATLAGPGGSSLAGAAAPLGMVSLAGALFLVVLGLLALRCRGLLRGRRPGRAPTWGCGYSVPAARMQYTAASFAQPITDFFAMLLRTKRRVHMPDSYFPAAAKHHTETPDVCSEEFYRPLFRAARQLLSRFRVLQAGSIHAYVLYMVLTLLALLLWELR